MKVRVNLARLRGCSLTFVLVAAWLMGPSLSLAQEDGPFVDEPAAQDEVPETEDGSRVVEEPDTTPPPAVVDEAPAAEAPAQPPVKRPEPAVPRMTRLEELNDGLRVPSPKAGAAAAIAGAVGYCGCNLVGFLAASAVSTFIAVWLSTAGFVASGGYALCCCGPSACVGLVGVVLSIALTVATGVINVPSALTGSLASWGAALLAGKRRVGILALVGAGLLVPVGGWLVGAVVAVLATAVGAASAMAGSILWFAAITGATATPTTGRTGDPWFTELTGVLVATGISVAAFTFGLLVLTVTTTIGQLAAVTAVGLIAALTGRDLAPHEGALQFDFLTVPDARKKDFVKKSPSKRSKPRAEDETKEEAEDDDGEADAESDVFQPAPRRSPSEPVPY